jgi:predicted SnoaL-like aldol condensation-catalyzing enzyme
MADVVSNKEIVMEVLTGVFIGRDPMVVRRYFADDYAQHNPTIPNGPDAILSVLAALSPDFNYEPGIVAADGDIVMVHGRYVGWAPKPVVGVDIFRVSQGKVAEHGDVLQEEVPAE